MFKSPLLLGLLILWACYGRVDASPCPLPNHPGNVHSSQVIAALGGGSVPLLEGVDTQCYNYSLPYHFQSAPEVAIAVHDFESENSNTVFFFIKTLHSQSVSTIPFVIRTYWSYTRWTQISFSFIAEDRHDLQSGYYQIDSGELSGCQNGKQVQILMPFRNNFNNQVINHHLFLHGFQITTTSYGQARSPYEIQIVRSVANVTGIGIILSTTSTTNVDSLYISYVAYQTTTLDLIVGSYVFDRSSSSSLAHTPDVSIPRSYARIYGINGFVINYNTYSLSLQTRWDGFSFTFSLNQFTSLTQYFSFSYIFFINSQCKDCPGYPIAFNNTCISNCPFGTFLAPDSTCRDCGKGKVWNGSECVIQCPTGQYLNTVKNECECPPSLNWNGQQCIPCTSGKIFVKQSLSCQCPQPFKWNGFACAQVQECKNGKVWSVYSFSCVCPQTSFWNGTFCVTINPCSGGQVHNARYQCVCPSNYYWNGNSCIYSPCVGGQIWQGTKCVCPANKNFDGNMCVQCINGQVWDSNDKKCKCEDGYKWNSQYCERTYECTGNRVWNTTYEQCICPQRSYWSGYACFPIPSCNGGQFWNSVLQKCVCSNSAQWNGSRCIICRNGQIWDTATLQCVCPPGTFIIGGRCQIQQQCTGGKMFMQNTLKCQCPETTTWNGDYCISNPCSNGRKFDETYRSCVCPDNKVWTGSRCVPPQISCNNGRVWNPAIYACECPTGTYPNYNKCDPIPICRNGTTYNPLNNKCACPYGQVMVNFRCDTPNCPTGQYYNGYECEVISCPPPSYFYENRCIYGGQNQCTYGYTWNGLTCVLHPPTCPLGTHWKNSNCQAAGSCQDGSYLSSSGSCQALPQKCSPSTQWNGEKCQSSGSQCPSQTFYSNGRCQPYTPCKNGHVWDYVYLKCICPSGLISNGVSCVQCSNGKAWNPSQGCICPEGSFDTGTSCQSLTENRCVNVPNTIWDDNKCLCRPGFTKVGFQCTCYGTQIGDFCDKCSYKPNSQWISSSDVCQCLDGYTQIRGNCVRNTLSIGNHQPSSCNVGTYFDSNQKMCLPCPDGCLSCFDCYRCKRCRPEFIYNPANQQCYEKCGDGVKFNLQCDDGNNKDGDGCTRDCKIQPGYACSGGSPDNKDQCYPFTPERVTLQQTGQIRKSTSIVLNVKLNYLPSSLMFSGDCANNCNQVLVVNIINGDQSAVSISSHFIVGTKYSFAITIDYGRPYIGAFTASISVAQELIPRYFGAIPTDSLTVEVKPNYLASVNDQDRL